MSSDDDKHHLDEMVQGAKRIWRKTTKPKIVAITVAIGFVAWGAIAFFNETVTFSENLKKADTLLFDVVPLKATEDAEQDNQTSDNIEDNSDVIECIDCQSIHEAALRDVNEYRLTTPTENNAFSKYQTLKSKGFEQATDLLRKIIDQYHLLIDSAINNKKFLTANTLLNSLATVDPDTDQERIAERIKVAQLIYQKEIEKSEARKTQLHTAKEEPPRKESVNHEYNDPRNRTAVSVEWLNGLCLALRAVLTDSTKSEILKDALPHVQYISAYDLYIIYACSRLLTDSKKVEIVYHLVNKVNVGNLSSDQFNAIIQNVLTDSAKSQVSRALLPLLNSR